MISHTEFFSYLNNAKGSFKASKFLGIQWILQTADSKIMVVMLGTDDLHGFIKKKICIKFPRK